MAKQYQLFFEPEVTEKIEKIALESGLRSGRQWILEQVDKAIKKYEEAAKAFDMQEFVFLMKDGSYRRAKGANAGGAWRALGFSTEDAPDKMDSYKTLDDAREAGWPMNSLPTAKIDAPPAQQEAELPFEGAKAEQRRVVNEVSDDLPFGS